MLLGTISVCSLVDALRSFEPPSKIGNVGLKSQPAFVTLRPCSDTANIPVRQQPNIVELVRHLARCTRQRLMVQTTAQQRARPDNDSSNSGSAVPWHTLPEACLTLVLGFLESEDVATARLVSRQWAEIGLLSRTSLQLFKPLNAHKADFILKHMQRLRSLQLNYIVTVFHLHRLTQLTAIHIESTRVPDFEPMAGLTNLQLLSIEKCRCGELTPLSGLTRLTALELYRCEVTNLAPLSTLTNLCTAKLHGNPAIVDATPLSELLKLTRLQLSQSGITELRPLCALTNLECLFLDRSQLSADLSPLVYLINLAHLSLTVPHRNEVNVAPLAALTRMHCLDLIDCKLVNLAALSGLHSLRRLGMRKSRVSDINSVSTLNKLTSLDVRRSNFNDMGLLAPLKELRLLVMDETDNPQALNLPGPSAVTVLRDDAGYLGCSFKHSNLKHMCDRHSQRANSAGQHDAPQLAPPDIPE
ncbi:hypothetical protein WJX73_004341 [Symbiochloris irregularis]|uniref:F-box domain-containing protein n=1 Tax=Symbiochloris irregularis TaxID=706552 RepID=A0AAW1NLU5_9CHLO